MAKRAPGGGSTKAPPKENKPVGLPESHSGEGTASVIETLQKLEKRRLPEPPEHGRTDGELPTS